jgi:cytosine/adenosine deaminase-related metal-dependent hydrolase
MRFLTADYLYPLYTNPIKEGVLQISDFGEVITIFENRAVISKEKLEIFDGILCPGFVNAHCHLELSHLLGKTGHRKGLLNFIGTVHQRNDFSKKKIQKAIEEAEQQMIKNGIVAVGDICNTSDTLLQKKKQNLRYYNFIEVFGVKDELKDQLSADAKVLRNKFRATGQKATISPHAPYSVPPKLMKIIRTSFDNEDSVLTIHNQETIEENQLFENKKGKLKRWLENINASSEIWSNREKSVDILRELEGKKVMFAHNTFSKKEDLTDSYYCTCPKANLYIENSLPDYSIFNTEKLCVGTDSLASNDSLSILEELLVIKQNSNFDLNTLLKISCKNGAEALGFSDLGTFEKGKKPGVNLIYGLKKVSVIA